VVARLEFVSHVEAISQGLLKNHNRGRNERNRK
jgi:hypothetical protein